MISNGHSKVRCAVVGYGRFGSFLAQFIQQNVPSLQVASIVVHPRDDALRVQNEMGDIAVYRSLEALLNDAASSIDAVILTSANYEHRDQAIAAARAGKHVFCEKPMAITTDDCLEMVRAAAQADIKLMVGHKRRLRPAWQQILQLAHTGELGSIVAANINGWHHHDDIPEWFLDPKLGGGLLHRAGCHDIDFLHALLGESRWVQAVASPNARLKSSSFNETMWLTIGFASGAVGGLQVALWYQPVSFRDSFDVQVLGSKGSVLLDRDISQTQKIIIEVDGQSRRTLQIFDDAQEAYKIELQSFARWITHGQTPVMDWREGLACVRVMEAAYQSAQQNGLRIDLEGVRL